MDITVFRTGPLDVNTLIVPLCPGFVFVTDPGGNIAQLDRFMKQHSAVPSFVVCTHGHFDHVLGLSDFLSVYPGTPVAAGKDDSVYFGAESASRHGADLHALGLDYLAASAASMPLPDVMLGDGMRLDSVCPEAAAEVKSAASCWTVLHTAGHSAGSLCLYNKTGGVLLSGDTLFYGGYGRTDLYGGDEHAMMQSLRRLSALPGSVSVYPGHGTAPFRLDEAF